MLRPSDDAPGLIDFGRLYREYAGDVRRFARFLTGNPALADDLVSEAFVRVWTARDRVDLSTVRGYLFAIVRNMYLHELRRERRDVPLDDRTPAGCPGPETQASDRNRLEVLRKALGTLPEIDRAAVLMRADDHLPYEEIATALGISTAAARVKVHRARLRLAEALEGAITKE